MNSIDFSFSLCPEVRRFSHGFISYVLDGCDPRKLIPDAIDFESFGSSVHVLAFGKASVSMTRACVDGLSLPPVGGVVLSPEALIPSVLPCPSIRFFGVDHPLPSARNVDAAQKLKAYAQSIPAHDECIVCISGGGSAHLCSPKPGVTLEQVIDTTRTLNASGADIHQLNNARQSLETLKGGGLAEVLRHVEQCRVIVLSDVLDDDLETIASGPMMSDLYPVEHTIVGNHRTALKAACDFLKSWGRERGRGRGVKVGYFESGVSGESREVAHRLSTGFMEHPMTARIVAGETVVDTQGTNGGGRKGKGGPCMELALATALRLAESGDLNWVVLGLATDGIDGPTNAAGAVITGEMLGSESTLGRARRALESHDSLGLLDSIGASFRTGPTGTNLNDLCLVCPRDALQMD